MKPSVVCVDLDRGVLGALEQALRPHRHAVAAAFFTDPVQALAALPQARADVVIADPLLPGPDGMPFLAHVEARWPRAMRIGLLRLGADVTPGERLVAHACVPVDGDLAPVVALLETFAVTRAALPGTELAAHAVGLVGLPPAGPVFREVFEAIAAGASPDDIARLAERDIAVTAKILQLGGPAAAHGVRAALASLDGNLVQHALFALGGVPRPDDAVLEGANEHAHTVARAAALIVPEPELRESAYLAGLLHDVGELVAPTVDALHAELGAFLLAVWGLPRQLCEAVAYHHRPSAQTCDDVTLADVVHFAETMVCADRTTLDDVRLRQLDRSGRLDWWRKGAAGAPTAIRGPRPGRT